MPSIFQIAIQVNCGSVGRIAEQIGETAINGGWESYITYSRSYFPSKSKIIKIGNKFDTYWHGINTRIFDNHCLCSVYATKKLVDKIKQIKPDIIHLHNIHGYYLNMKILFDFLKNNTIPVVWTLHDCWSFTGHCVHFDFIGCNKWITGCYKCPQKSTYPVSRILDQSRRNYKLKKQLFNGLSNMTIVPVSYWLGELVKNSFLNKYPIHVIQNGVDIDVFHPVIKTDTIKNKYNIENKFILLGVAGTWSTRKGLNDFIKLDSIIDHNVFEIVLVGLNKHQIKKLPKCIIGIERTENVNELAALYSAADVHISCSVEETFGLTILESMACGTPVVTYNCTAITELVDNETGFIVERGDLESIKKSIMEIKEKKKSHYTDNCLKKVMALYNCKDRYKEYIDLYNQLIK